MDVTIFRWRLRLTRCTCLLVHPKGRHFSHCGMEWDGAFGFIDQDEEESSTASAATSPVCTCMPIPCENPMCRPQSHHYAHCRLSTYQEPI